MLKSTSNCTVTNVEVEEEVEFIICSMPKLMLGAIHNKLMLHIVSNKRTHRHTASNVH